MFRFLARCIGITVTLTAALACGGARERPAPAAAAGAAADRESGGGAGIGGGPDEAARAGATLTATPIPSPAGPASGEPGLASAGGRAYLSWLERRGGEGGAGADGEALLFAAWDGASWTPPVTVAAGVPFFVNWADTPSVLPMADGTLVAHWLQKAGGDTYAYHVMLSWSGDGGSTWSPPVSPHADRSATEHGFVSLVDLGPGRFGAAWLDGRRYATGPGSAAETAIMFAEYRGGSSRGEVMLDPRVCDCCQTAVAATPAGVVVAYRDRSSDEIRDISRVIVPVESGAAAPPTPAPLGRDGWTIAGCPVNGPAIAASEARVVAAWFTGAQDAKRVFAAFSSDAGATFGDPIRIDLGEPAGRVDVEWLADGRALVTWIEDGPGAGGGAGEEPGSGDAARIMARVIDPGGRAAAAFVLATTTSARASGFPRLARAGGDLLMAWTDPAEPPRVRLVRIARPRS